MKYGLTPFMLSQLDEVFHRYPQIEKVLLHGARARGTYVYHSDISLSLWGKTLSIDTMLEIEEELEDLEIPHKIRVHAYHQLLHASAKDAIRKDGKILYRKVKRVS